MRMMARRPTVGFALAGAALLATSMVVGSTAAGGQSAVETSELDAELAPTETTAGDEITVRSVGTGCVSEQRSGLVWAVFPRGDFVWGEQLGWQPDDAITSGVGYPGAYTGGYSGSWRLTFPAPDVGDGPAASGEIGPGSPPTSSVLQVYGPLPFTVDGHELEFVAKCFEQRSGYAELDISPEVPELGGSATVTPDEPCPMPHTAGGSVAVELWSLPADVGSIDDVFGTLETTDLGPVPVADDGSWSLTFDVPDTPDRRLALNVGCRNVEGGSPFGYILEPFDVREPGGAPIETPPDFWDEHTDPSTPPAAAPAQPVRAEPSYTG